MAGGQAVMSSDRKASIATTPAATITSDAPQARSSAAWRGGALAARARSLGAGAGAGAGGGGSSAAAAAGGSGAGGGAALGGAACGSAKSAPQREQRSDRAVPASSRSGTSYSAPQEGHAIRMHAISTRARCFASSG